MENKEETEPSGWEISGLTDLEFKFLGAYFFTFDLEISGMPMTEHQNKWATLFDSAVVCEHALKVLELYRQVIRTYPIDFIKIIV